MVRIVIFNICECECQCEYFITIFANANIKYFFLIFEHANSKKHANIRICEYLDHH